ncbi:hypothetical protein AI2913V1_2661 [Klebsiella aerogenes]|nr:hypothetical protein F8B42_00256 [Klebsiella aerogenes]CAF9429271.1 hypothetical protein AI2913V1_2661 [Klebsiella aerogenes]CAH5884213.1 hypothetical protein AI2913V1_2661 [Klebsiella aerogenes]
MDTLFVFLLFAVPVALFIWTVNKICDLIRDVKGVKK